MSYRRIYGFTRVYGVSYRGLQGFTAAFKQVYIRDILQPTFRT